MRLVILSAIAALAAQPALASSIEKITGTRLNNDSILNVSCPTCPPLKVAEEKGDYLVPKLADGVQTEEIREVGGTREVIRVDRWMGGSPSTHISKTPVAALTEDEAEKTIAEAKARKEEEAAREAAAAAAREKQALEAQQAQQQPPQDAIDNSAKTSAVSGDGPAELPGMELRLK